MSSERPEPPREKCGVDRLIDLLEQDIDRDLLEQARRRTPTERILWLEEMQSFAEAAARARAAKDRA